jgi:RND family efflux transporter MFP subunit
MGRNTEKDKMIRTIIIGIVIITLASAGYFYFSVGDKGITPIPVKMEQVRHGKFVSSFSAEGKIVARKRETLVSPNAGIVHDKGMTPGKFLPKGSIVAYVSLPEEEAIKKRQDYELAKIDLDDITEQVNESKKLFEAKAVSLQECRELEVRKLKQEKLVQNLQDDLKDKPVRTRFDGILVEKLFNDGDRVSIGTNLGTVIDPHSLLVQVNVPQHLLSKVKVGQLVEYGTDIYSEMNGEKGLHGAVIELPNIANEQGVQQNGIQGSESEFTITASIQNDEESKLLVGSKVDIEFVLAVKNETLFVPLEAILFRDEKPVVFISSYGHAIRRYVKIGLTNDHFVEIAGGLIEKDTVITSGNIDLENGNPIKDLEHEQNDYHTKSRGGLSIIPQ